MIENQTLHRDGREGTDTAIYSTQALSEETRRSVKRLKKHARKQLRKLEKTYRGSLSHKR